MRKIRDFITYYIAIIAPVFIGVTFALVANFTDLLTSEKDATRALSASGYTDIQTGGYKFFYCGKHDGMLRTSFTAKNPQGTEVQGVVCSGILQDGAKIVF